MDDAKEMARLEARAEEAYGAMYQASPTQVKDLYDDARQLLNRALILAQRLGLDKDAVRLAARGAHIDDVYNHQFRHIGR